MTISLSNKYRPTDFSEVIGQESIIKILSKQLELKSYKNCYLFSGPSGCGKTTLARIFSKKINYGVGNPIEIDAASNNGVDNIRNIIEGANQRSLDSEYKVYIIDECFIGDTIIYTSNGSKKIKDIVPGDRVLTLNGFNKVTHVHQKVVENSVLNLLTLTNGEKIVTTADHLFLTSNGWVESKNLKKGDLLLDGENMLKLWKSLHNKTQDPEILQQQVSTCIPKEPQYKGFNREDLSYLWEHILCGKQKRLKEDVLRGLQKQVNIAVRKDYNEFRIWDGAKETIIFKNDKSKSYDKSKDNREDALNERIEWNSSQMDWEERGEWLVYRTSDKALECIRKFLGIGISDKNELLREQPKQISYVLQSRPWLSRDKISDRGGWQQSQLEKWYCERFKEGYLPNTIGVESIEIYEPGDNGKYPGGITKDTTLFDLTVENSPTYFANGVLVHNCHMITTQGWNAFLKCIEEPPKYTMFMFCTTDPQKVPATIVNRCQVYNLNRISSDKIFSRLSEICEAEEYAFETEALNQISKMSGGSLRQAIAYLDKCKDFSTTILLNNVFEVLGDYSYDTMFELTNSIMDNNQARIVEIIEKLYLSGSDLKLFIDSYIDFVLDLAKYCIFKNYNLIKIPRAMSRAIEWTTNIENNVKFFNRFVDKLLVIKQTIKGDSMAKNTIEIMLLNMERI